MRSDSKPGAIAVAAAWLVFAAAAARSLEVSPRNPTECDVLTLRVRRSFAQDCLWEVTPKVRRERQAIEVTLELKGRAACDQALTDRTFDVPIGSYPAGNYRLSVRWSDGEVVGSRDVTVDRKRSRRK